MCPKYFQNQNDDDKNYRWESNLRDFDKHLAGGTINLPELYKNAVQEIVDHFNENLKKTKKSDREPYKVVLREELGKLHIEINKRSMEQLKKEATFEETLTIKNGKFQCKAADVRFITPRETKDVIPEQMKANEEANAYREALMQFREVSKLHKSVKKSGIKGVLPSFIISKSSQANIDKLQGIINDAIHDLNHAQQASPSMLTMKVNEAIKDFHDKYKSFKQESISPTSRLRSVIKDLDQSLNIAKLGSEVVVKKKDHYHTK